MDMMESSLHILLLSLCLAALLYALFSSPKPPPKLPPGPRPLPFLGNLLSLPKSLSFFHFEPALRRLFALYGPILTLRLGPRPTVFIAVGSLAHHALVENGAAFADRPPALPTTRVFNNNAHNISSSTYGPNWRLLRRNLTSRILHPSCLRSYSAARARALRLLLDRLVATSSHSAPPVLVADHFHLALLRLFVFMCFGCELEEERIREIQASQQRMITSIDRFTVLSLWPRLGIILFRNRWRELAQLCADQRDALVPLIRARLESKGEDLQETLPCYVDTLTGLELPEEKRRVGEGEMVSLCSEFLIASVDTTTAVLQWIMANLVKFPGIQEKLVAEIAGVLGEDGGEAEWVREEDLPKMPYLKAVVLEGLRRHPPGHFLVPHAVTEDAELDGHIIPKDTVVNFMVGEMGWDAEVWEDPMEFRPERFMGEGEGGEGFEVGGSRETKMMMPFGAGRRMCPGYAVALLHLEHFVANLVWRLEWKAEEEVDLSETQEFTIVMKSPLRARLTPRR